MAQRGSYNKISTKDRQRLIQAFQNGEDWQDFGRLLGIARRTVTYIVGRFIASGRIDPLPRGGAKRKSLSDAMVERICSYVQSNPTATLQQMKNNLRQEFPDAPDVNLSTISRALDGQLITLKLTRQVPQD